MSAEAVSALPAAEPPRSALVTGAAGYLGSTLVHRLLAEGCAVVALDHLQHGHADALPLGTPLVRGDIRDPEALSEALGRLGRAPDVVFHLAGLIQVGESMREPERYLSVNAGGTAALAAAALEAGVEAMVLASSAAVLASGQHADDRLDETWPLQPASPYGESKLAAERTLAAAADTGRMTSIALRMFNLCGAAHGCAERHAPETHLIPLAIGAALGRRPPLTVLGDDFPTPDGTPLRDYVHIEDVIEAFLSAGRRALALQRGGLPTFEAYHVGCGVPVSVLQVIAAVERVLGRKVPYEIGPRRPGDAVSLVADPTLLARRLGVRPFADLDRAVRDSLSALRPSPAIET